MHHRAHRSRSICHALVETVRRPGFRASIAGLRHRFVRIGFSGPDVGSPPRDFAHGSPGNGGILLHEIRSCLYPVRDRPNVINFMGGLGGRDISIEECIKMYERTLAAGRGDMPEEIVTWTGLRE